jgi:hypothetical protein
MTKTGNFYIFDCNGDIVGNSKGYKTHRGAQAQCERTGKIRTAIFTAHHLKEWPKNGIKHLYSIRWVDYSKPAPFANLTIQKPIEPPPLIQAAQMLGKLQIIHVS